MADGRVTITESPPLRRFILRGGAVAGSGLALPAQSCRAAEADERAALWLGPDEWLLLMPVSAPSSPPEEDAAGSVVEVSDRQIGLRIEGSRAEMLLNAACPLDLHVSAFPTGMCSRTIFGKAEIVLWRMALERFHLEVARSFAAYVRDLLHEAARDLET
jgi:sarcosine oxidase subunit gamma